MGRILLATLRYIPPALDIAMTGRYTEGDTAPKGAQAPLEAATRARMAWQARTALSSFFEQSTRMCARYRTIKRPPGEQMLALILAILCATCKSIGCQFQA